MKHLFLSLALLLAATCIAQVENCPVEIVNGQQVYVYEVQKGEGLYRISQNFHVTQSEIIELNPMVETRGLQLGQKIYIPCRKVEGNQAYVTHTLQPGETLYGLSRRYGVTVQSLTDLNPNAKMHVGEVLLIKPMGTTAQPEVTAQPKVEEQPAEQSKAEQPKAEETKVPEKKLEMDITKPADLKKDKASEVVAQPLQKVEATEKTRLWGIGEPIRLGYVMPFSNALEEPGKAKKLNYHVDFYLGALVAIYEEQLKGEKFEIFTYNAFETPAGMEAALANEDLKKVDFLFGAAQPAQAPTVARFAEENHIYTMMPFSTTNVDFDNNPYVMKTVISQEEEIATLIEGLYADKEHTHIIVVRDTTKESADNRGMHMLRQFEQNQFDITYTTPAELEKDTLGNIFKASVENMLLFTEMEKDYTNSIKHMVEAISERGFTKKISLLGRYKWATLGVPMELIYSNAFHEIDPKNIASYSEIFNRYFDYTVTGHHDLLGYDLTKAAIAMIKQMRTVATGEDIDIILTSNYEGVYTDVLFHKANEAGGFINRGARVSRSNK